MHHSLLNYFPDNILNINGNKGMASHLYASFRQVDGESQPLSHVDIRVLCLLEGFFQRLQLWHGEGGAAAALLLLVAIPSLQNKLWQETQTGSSPK